MASEQTVKPIITDELITYLKALYPDVAPELTWSDREVWKRRGEAGVIRHLLAIQKEQKEDMLGNSIVGD